MPVSPSDVVIRQIKAEADEILTVDPPPDVVIEVDLTNPLLPKFAIFAQLGIPEVWRYDGRRGQILRLVGGEYVRREQSTAFPGLTEEVMTALLDESKTLQRLAWLRRVRIWARERRTADASE